MQTQRSRSAWVVFILFVTGCNSTVLDPEATAPVGTPSEGACSGADCETAAPGLGELSYIFESAAEPTDIAVELDTGAMVEALIPVEGGAIRATGADGTIYTLEIPTDALLNETSIRLTPAAGITGLPFGGERTYAVQLGPENLSLFNLAVLTITPAEPLPFGEQIIFGFQKAGTDLVLAAPVVDSQEIKINVLHFGGYGVTRGTLADVPPERRQLGGTVDRRLENAVGAELIGLRNDGGVGAVGTGALLLISFRNESGKKAGVSDSLAEAILQYEEQVVRPRVAAAGESCAAGELAQETVLGVRSQRQLLGMDAGPEYPGLFNTVAKVCVIEEFEACVEQHRIYLMQSLLYGLERQNQMLGMVGLLDGAIREARDLTIKCLTFRLEFESTGTFDAGTGDGSGYDSTVTSELIMRYSPEQGFILGAIAELVNTDFEFRFADCSVTSATGGGVFSVLALSYEFAFGAADEDGNYPDAGISDLRLVYMPGNTSESYTINPCDPMGAIQVPLFPAWTLAFMAAHHGEFTGGGFEAVDWEILGGELFAEKEWSLASTQGDGLTDVGSFELYHTPGQ